MEFQVGGRSVAAVVQEFQPLGEHVLGAGKSRKWEFVVEEENGENIYHELYISGNRVAVSNGTDREARTVKATYEVKSDIVQAFSCQFFDPDDKDGMNGLCIVEEVFLHFYSSSGNCFPVPLAFQVGCVCPLKNGIIIQEKQQNSTVTPQVYCLFHPADVLSPVAFNLLESSDDCWELVWACPDPALVVFVNIQTGIHSIWFLKPLEPTGPSEMIFDNAVFQPMANVRLTSHTPFLGFGSDLGRASSQSSRGSLHQNPVHGQPASPFSTGRTPENGRLTSQTHAWSGGADQNTVKSESLATVLHCGSSRSRNQALSHEIPHPLSQHIGPTDYRPLPCFGSHLAGRKKRVSSSSVASVDHDEDVSGSEYMFLESLCAMSPTMELNRVWIDSVDEGDLNERSSSKAFLYKDFSEKCFICILNAGKLKLIESNMTSNPTLVLSNCLRCKDALPLMGFGVLLILREGNQLSLYCGEQEVCQIGFDYDCNIDHLVSSVRNNAYLEIESGQAVQLVLPDLPTYTPVEICLKALRCVLPYAVYNSFHSLWYVCAAEASKRTNIAGNKLLEIFNAFMLEACGVNEVNMDTEESSETVNEAEEWKHLLHDLEKPGTNNTAFFIGLPRIEIQAASLTTKPKQLRVEAFSLLRDHLAVVFFSLHLVHEEMKLNTILHGSLPVLAQLLVTLGLCLSCQSYIDYYCSSYPMIEQGVALESCPLPAPMEKYLSNPYDIMVWLQNAFETVQKPFPVLNGVTRRTQDICLVFSMFSWLCGVFCDSSKIVEPFGLNGDDKIRSAASLYEKLEKESSTMNAVVQFMAIQGYSREVLSSFPLGIAVPIEEALHHCCNDHDPPTDWPIEAYRLLGRNDLAKQKDVADGKNPWLEPKPTIRPSQYIATVIWSSNLVLFLLVTGVP
jgi:anaphase-promoting complex subunit 1